MIKQLTLMQNSNNDEHVETDDEQDFDVEDLDEEEE